MVESPPHRLAYLWSLLHAVCASVSSPRTAEGRIGREPACSEPSCSAQPTTRVTRGASAQGGRAPMPGLPQRGEHALPAKRKRANEPPPPTHGACMQPKLLPPSPLAYVHVLRAHARPLTFALAINHARALLPPPPPWRWYRVTHPHLSRSRSSQQTLDALSTACAHRLTAATWNV